MFIRKIGALLRGKATPMQLLLACLLGALLGFVPVAGQSPGLVVVYILLLLVLNANVGIFLLVALLCKLIALLAMPLSFKIGQVLIDGPARGLVETAVNAPVAAFFGLEYYATTGGIMVGAVVGLILGFMLVGILNGFRRKMAKMEEGSEGYQKVAGKGWSRFLMWLLIGGKHGKTTYAEMLERGRGNPIRIPGVIVAGLAVAGFFFAPSLIGEPVLTSAAKSGLEGFTGATVDLSGVELSTAEGRLVLSGLAMADPDALDTDVFRASRLEADVSGSDLLRARMVLDKVVVRDAESGTARTSPAERIRDEDEDEPEDEALSGLPDLVGVQDDLKEMEEWKNRIETIAKWVERLAPDPSEEDEGPSALERARERLEREIEAAGYARVYDDSLERDAPTLLIRHLEAGGMRFAGLEDQTFDLTLYNISTHPSLVPEPGRLVLKSSDGKLNLDIILDENAGAAVRDALGDVVLGGVQARVDEERSKLEAKVEEKKNEKIDEVKKKADDKLKGVLGGLFGGDDDDN
jgi:uncharacterized protein (TIGR03546 family)